MLYYGENSLSKMTSLLEAGKHQSVLLVTGGASYELCGAGELLLPVLEGRQVKRVHDFETHPKKEDLLRILNEIKEVDFSVIIAVGGGSVMDIAKLIKCFKDDAARMDGVLHEGEDVSPSGVDLYAIPTTAGSGSEATHFAVIYADGVKHSVAHHALLPDAVWIVSSLLATVPTHVAAAAAMDVLCQGVESYWSIHSTLESQQWSKQAILLAWQHMSRAVLERDDNALELMGKAAHLAGKAINITKTTAPHAISYAFTSHFGVLHGHGVVLTLPAILEFNDGVSAVDLQDPRGVAYVRSTLLEVASMLGCAIVREAAEVIVKRTGEIGLSVNLHDLGIMDASDREIIIQNGFNPQRVGNNPRKITADDLREILDSMLGGRGSLGLDLLPS